MDFILLIRFFSVIVVGLIAFAFIKGLKPVWVRVKIKKNKKTSFWNAIFELILYIMAFLAFLFGVLSWLFGCQVIDFLTELAVGGCVFFSILSLITLPFSSK